MMQPFLLLPEFVERPWGTRDLSLIYPHKTARRGGEFEEPVGEVWLTGEMCRVATGPLQGQTLGEVTKQFGSELVGKAALSAESFPLLIKFLFPQEKLSVQVHPDDEFARRHGLPNGKNECWYVYSAGAGAQVALGLNADFVKDGVPVAEIRAKVEAAINSGDLETKLNWVDLRAGEMINVPAGTIHAIGPGSVLVEVQQNSDVTYRLFDYGRGRALHIADGLEAMHEPCRAGKVERISTQTKFGSVALLNSTPHFVIEKFTVREPATFTGGAKSGTGKSSVQILVGLEGCGIIECSGGPSL